MTERTARKRARSTIQEVGSLMTQCTLYYSDYINSDNYRSFYYDSYNNSDNYSGDDDKNNYIAFLLNFLRINSSLHCTAESKEDKAESEAAFL